MLKVNKSTGEIYLYDVIGADLFDEGVTAMNVQTALETIGNKKAIVRINSPGGVADEGVAIYNILKRHKPGVETHNDSLAASAASLVFMAGDERYMAKGSRVMIHRASTVVFGNSDRLRKIATTLDSYDAAQAEILGTHMGLSQEELLPLLDAETWYSADDAIAAKLATKKSNEDAREYVGAEWFANPPQDIAAAKTVIPMSRLAEAKVAAAMRKIDPQWRMKK